MKKIIIILSLSLLMLLTVQSISAQTPATAIVTAYHLNVRDYPDPTTGNIIARVGRNEVYQVAARSSFNNWWQLRLSDGRLGWVNGGYISVYGAETVPVVNPTGGTPTVVTAYGTVTAYYLNVRNMPNATTGGIIATISRNETYTVIGRNANSSWWQILFANGASGWVNGNFLSVINAQTVPQTNNTVPPGTVMNATGIVTAYYLNVRTAPSPIYGSIISVISRGQTFEVVGRNANSTWWQIRVGNTTGWVNSGYFSVSNGGGLPVTG